MGEINKKFYNMLQPKTNPDPLMPDFEFIIPSGQFWYNLTLEEQAELRQIVAEEGQNLDNYLYEMRRMLPKDPNLRKR